MTDRTDGGGEDRAPASGDDAMDRTVIGEDDDGIRLDRWVRRHRPGVPHALVSRWAREGALILDGARAAPSTPVAAGQTLVMPRAEPSTHAPAPRKGRPLSSEDRAMADAMVIHRDHNAIVINKPAGLATQGGTKTDRHVDGMLDAYASGGGDRPKLVHRLDKDTSGVLLLARSARAAGWYAKAFSARTARKTYWALVMGVPDIARGEINLPLGKQPGTGGEKMHVDEAAGQAARTRYRIVERAGNSAAWVELQPMTGRTHQLRVHMAAIGHPIVGDGKYGGKNAYLTGTISRKMHLHARRLRLEQPPRRQADGTAEPGGMLDVTAELPDHFAQSMDALGFDIAVGDALAAEDRGPAEKGPRPPDKADARAHAKQVRKARRGERRGRADAAKPGVKAGPARKPVTRKAKPRPVRPDRPPARGPGGGTKPARPTRGGR